MRSEEEIKIRRETLLQRIAANTEFLMMFEKFPLRFSTGAQADKVCDELREDVAAMQMLLWMTSND